MISARNVHSRMKSEDAPRIIAGRLFFIFGRFIKNDHTSYVLSIAFSSLKVSISMISESKHSFTSTE